MTDPWADVRAKSKNGDYVVFGTAAIDIDVAGLLTDADALLAVVPLVREAVDGYELPVDMEQTLRDWLDALPEYLK